MTWGFPQRGCIFVASAAWGFFSDMENFQMADKKKTKKKAFSGGVNPRLVMRYPKPKPKPKRKK